LTDASFTITPALDQAQPVQHMAARRDASQLRQSATQERPEIDKMLQEFELRAQQLQGGFTMSRSLRLSTLAFGLAAATGLASILPVFADSIAVLTTRDGAGIAAVEGAEPAVPETFEPAAIDPELVKELQALTRFLGGRPSIAKGDVAAATDGGSKIVGGALALPGEFPFQVAILGSLEKKDGQFARGSQRCGGSMITDRWVLTAAHCVISIADNGDASLMAADTFAIAVGDNKWPAGEWIGVDKVIAHPKYNPATTDNDIALMRLERAPQAPYQAITLLAKQDESRYVPANAGVTVIGWGLTQGGGEPSKDLLRVDLKVLNRAKCRLAQNNMRIQGRPQVAGAIDYLSGQFNLTGKRQEAFVKFLRENGQSLTDNMFCAGVEEGGKDSCNGDSGGPMFRRDPDGRFVQVGIVSWGPTQCAMAGTPGVYTRLSLFTDWVIDTVVRENAN
jgi:secreted trypsin-like serine protease